MLKPFFAKTKLPNNNSFLSSLRNREQTSAFIILIALYVVYHNVCVYIYNIMLYVNIPMFSFLVNHPPSFSPPPLLTRLLV